MNPKPFILGAYVFAVATAAVIAGGAVAVLVPLHGILSGIAVIVAVATVMCAGGWLGDHLRLAW